MGKRIYMCCGSDCKKRNKLRKAIRARLRAAGIKKTKIEKVRCQKICKGPVFGVEIDDCVEWFRRVELDDAEPLAAVARGEPPAPSLVSKRVAKRSGKLRK